MSLPTTAAGQSLSPAGNAPSAATQRFDRPHAPARDLACEATSPPTPEGHETREGAQADRHNYGAEWLRLHAEDLIAQLAEWSAEIDARQSQLNAQQAMLDLERRQFRAWRSSELRELAEQRQSLERQQADAVATSRRLAAAQWAAR